MMPLFAHHLEAHHVPVLLGLFAAGVYVGWQVLGRWLPQRVPARADAQPPQTIGRGDG